LGAGVKTTLHCGVLIDGLSQTARSHIVIELDGNRISAVGTYDPSKSPSYLNLIDLSSETCLPGLIDTHAHFIASDPKAPVANAVLEEKTRKDLLQTLRYGFTTIRNLGSDAVWPSDVRVRSEVEQGLYPSPRLKIALVAPNYQDFRVKGPDALKKKIDEIITLGSDWVKLFGDIGWADPPRYSEEELRAMVVEAHGKGVKVAMHTIGPEDSRRAIASHVDSIEHGVEIRDEDLQKMRSFGIVYVPTPYVIEYIANHPGVPDRESFPERLARATDTFERAFKAGVKIAFGTDAGVDAAGFNTVNPAGQFRLMVQHKMPPMDAIQSATKNAAELLDMDKLIGTVEAGKLADIVAVTGDPLQDIRILEHVDFVMKDGTVFRSPR